MSSSTAQKPETIVEKMANEDYVRCKIFDIMNPNGTHPLHVGINEYSAWIPRNKPVLLASSLFSLVKEASDTVIFQKKNKKTGEIEDYTREHVNYSMIDKIGPMEAHEERLKDPTFVFPQKCPTPKSKTSSRSKD